MSSEFEFGKFTPSEDTLNRGSQALVKVLMKAPPGAAVYGSVVKESDGQFYGSIEVLSGVGPFFVSKKGASARVTIEGMVDSMSRKLKTWPLRKDEDVDSLGSPLIQ